MSSTLARTPSRALLLAPAVALAALLIQTPARAADDDILFKAVLSADDESTPTESPGTGIAEVRLERATLKITWKITYQGLTSPLTAAGLYGPENAGANAGEVVDLIAGSRSKRLSSPIEGSTILSDGVFGYLITGRVYVNLHSRRWPDGELRGQLRRQRSNAPPPPTPAK